MKIDFKGLKFKNWLYLMFFSVVILGVLWILQIVFLNAFYQKMKLNEFVKISSKIVAETTSSNFENLNEYSYNNNFRISLLDDDGKIKVATDGFRQFAYFGNVFLKPDELLSLKKEFSKSNKDFVYYINPNNINSISLLTYAKKINDNNNGYSYIYIVSPLPPIDSTITVLKNQFVYIFAILLVLSFFMAHFVSKKMTEPITRLTKLTEKLGQGNFNVSFNDTTFTEIQQLSKTLDYATTELNKRHKEQTEFLANMSHDLKTPLTIIKFYGEMIRDVTGDNKEKRIEQCDTIIRETDWLSQLVNEILLLSKTETKGFTLKKEVLDLTDCLKETLQSFQILTEKEKCIFFTNICENAAITADPHYLKRVLYNLISNAINYTGDDRIVKIFLEDFGDKFRFSVSDTGKGIPSSKLTTIWERYYYQSQKHKRMTIGTGLGLAIVKNCLDLHGFSYGVKSSDGQGSTFWFEAKKAN